MALDFTWQDGDRVMFIGDSITEDPQGYTHLVPTMVTARYPDRQIEYFPRGMGGNRIGDIFERIEGDILGNEQPPTWIALSLGINDVWHGATGTPPGRFRDLYDAMITQLSATKAAIACMTTTVIGEELDNEQNTALGSYNDIIREVAAARGAQLIDVNAAFRNAIQLAQARNPRFRFTTDDVHLNTYGQYLMSMVILASLNFAM
ncbi:MAG TPA: SGNH/GDSL hydrolase family protein [Armatimonadota bacterium]|nr:SGNH/GDSL hydrolase family protein [Armatimonadota bacterium]